MNVAQDGAKITVNGDAGTVTVLEEAVIDLT